MSRSQHVSDAERETALRQRNLRSTQYAYTGDLGKEKPPSFERLMKSLSDRDVIQEIERGRGDEGYQVALRDEARKRGLEI